MHRLGRSSAYQTSVVAVWPVFCGSINTPPSLSLLFFCQVQGCGPGLSPQCVQSTLARCWRACVGALKKKRDRAACRRTRADFNQLVLTGQSEQGVQERGAGKVMPGKVGKIRQETITRVRASKVGRARKGRWERLALDWDSPRQQKDSRQNTRIGEQLATSEGLSATVPLAISHKSNRSDKCLYSSVAKRQSCKLKVLGSIPSGGFFLACALGRTGRERRQRGGTEA